MTQSSHSISSPSSSGVRSAKHPFSICTPLYQQLAFAVMLLLAISACNRKTPAAAAGPDIPFEPVAWSEKSDGAYTYRKQMVNDMLHNRRWTGVKKDSVIRLLGSPDDTEEGSLSYTYDRKPSMGGLATSVEALVFELAADDAVKTVRLNDGGWD